MSWWQVLLMFAGIPPAIGALIAWIVWRLTAGPEATSVASKDAVPPGVASPARSGVDESPT